jgi:hypothetical protein
MESRYGVSREDAIGRSPARLLKTIFPRGQAEIDAKLSAHGTWIGGVINYHTDGSAIATMVRCERLSNVSGNGCFVVETHTDGVQAHTDTVSLFGDWIEAIVRELGEAATVLGAYNRGTRLILDHDSSSSEGFRIATIRSADQIRRWAVALRLLRGIVATMQKTEM